MVACIPAWTMYGKKDYPKIEKYFDLLNIFRYMK